MKRFFVLILAVLTVSVSSGIYADHDHSSKAHYPHVHSLDKFKETLKLSDSQVQEIEKSNKFFKEKHLLNKEKIGHLERRFRDLEKSESPDYGVAEQVLREIAELHTSIRLDKMKHHQALMKILTSEQKSEFKKHLDAKKEKRIEHSKDDQKDRYRGFY